MVSADLPKQATRYDLPIAIGILVGASQLESDVLEQYAAVGELSLEGQMRNVKGVLSIAIAAAKQPGIKGLLVPAENAQEAAVEEGLGLIIAFRSLLRQKNLFKTFGEDFGTDAYLSWTNPKTSWINPISVRLHLLGTPRLFAEAVWCMLLQQFSPFT